MNCPTHGLALRPRQTRYGVRRFCPHPGCTVVCWDGGTSTPADDETRTLRNQCHRRFDPLWRDESREGPFFRWRSEFNEPHHRRNRAYAWLSKELDLTRDACHFGYFNKATCEAALELIEAFIGSSAGARGAIERDRAAAAAGGSEA